MLLKWEYISIMLIQKIFLIYREQQNLDHIKNISSVGSLFAQNKKIIAWVGIVPPSRLPIYPRGFLTKV
jgi:hypothetical protein